MNTQNPDDLTDEELDVYHRYVRARERGIPVTGDSSEQEDVFESMKKHIRFLRHRWPIPPGLELCPDCFEYHGTTRIKYLKTSYAREDPEEEISIYCKCQGPLCQYCNKNRIRKPAGCFYTLSGQIVYCSGVFTWLRGCDDCDRKRNEDREARDKGN